jgi:biopolymer transport protein ExbB/TolQ
MIELRSGGVVMWPMMAVALGIVYLAVRTALRLWRGGDADAVHRGLQGVLFWGAMSVLLGALGTVGGLVQIAQAVARAAGSEPALIWGGVAVSLVSLLFGLVVFIVAATLWFGLHQWQGRRFEPMD